MTNENKQLLLKDLCGRLPYGVKVQCITKSARITGALPLTETLNTVLYGYVKEDNIELKPYLRPMSSMTEEEWIKFYKWANCRIEKDFGEIGSKSRGFCEGYEYLGIDDMSDAIDWLNEHHFDYRGLIEKGLALEAPKDMYSIK